MIYPKEHKRSMIELFQSYGWNRPARFEPLEKLYQHLASGKLAHSVFDMLCFNDTPEDSNESDDFVELEVGQCGTNGCMAGEMPAIWPDKFEWIDGIIRAKGAKLPTSRFQVTYTQYLLMSWFGLTDKQTELLFFDQTLPSDLEYHRSKLRFFIDYLKHTSGYYGRINEDTEAR